MFPGSVEDLVKSLLTTEEVENVASKKLVSGKMEDKKKSQFRVGRWDDEEHKVFLQGLQEHGKNWKKIAELIKTRSSVQTRTHAQKYFLKNAKQFAEANTKTMDLKKQNKTQKKKLDSVTESKRPNKKAKTEPSAQKIKIMDKVDHFTSPLTDQELLIQDVTTPRTINSFNKAPPSLGGVKSKQLQTSTEQKYKRSLDLEDPFISNPFAFAAAPKTGRSDFRISTPFDIEDSFDSASLSDHLSSDDDILLDDGAFDLLFTETF